MAERIAAVQSGGCRSSSHGGLVALLLSLGMALDGKQVLLGASPLGSKLGQDITDPRFNLVDDPLLDFGPQTSAFDDEGVPRKVTPLVENGVLRNFIYDLDTAGRAGAQPTGHGVFRNYTNLVVSPGEVAFEEMLKGVKQGLLVHDYLGLGQGNPMNGEFSVNLALGYKIENGEVVGRVKDVMLAGNAFQALKQITAISRERQWLGGPYSYFNGLFPYIQVDKLSVVAR
jgi:PmbA protein